MEAGIELEALVDVGSRLSLVGSYEPPGALVGRLTDLTFGHRVAESCVRRFVLDVADRLEGSRDPQPVGEGRP